MAFFNLKLLLKSKYFRKSIIIKSLYLLPTKITVAHFDEKPVFRPNLALLKGPKWSFGQNWTYLIWPNLVWDIHGQKWIFRPQTKTNKNQRLKFWTKRTKNFLNYKNGNEQLQKGTKNSSNQKVQKQYQTKISLFVTKSLQ